MSSRKERHLLVAVGSRHDRICSVGAFARAEARALRGAFASVELMEPSENGEYPVCEGVREPDAILFHAPSLHDRERPWNVVTSALKLKHAFPKAALVSTVHEYSEAPTHWKLRQITVARLSDAVIVNSSADLDGLKHWHKRVLKVHLGPTLFLNGLPESERGVSKALIEEARSEAKELIAAHFAAGGENAFFSGGKSLILHPGLITPGKGVNSLEKLIRIFEHATGGAYQLVIMGGKGPKARDREFAERTLKQLRDLTMGKLTVVEGAEDDLFKAFLSYADLIVLPYDEGVSERRSSFLSSMWCGGNVWVTSGPFSASLDLGGTGVHSVSSERVFQGHGLVRTSLESALRENAESVGLRRVANLRWAYGRSWKARSEKIAEFLEGVFPAMDHAPKEL